MKLWCRADWENWTAAGCPPLSSKQLMAAARSVAIGAGEPPEVGELFLLSQPPASSASPSRVPSNPTSSRPTKAGRTAGNGPKMATASKLRKKARKQLKQIRRHLLARGADPAEVKVMTNAGADPELLRLWWAQMMPGPAVTLAGASPEEVRIMASDGTDPGLRALWRAQMAAPEPKQSRSPLGMDDDRYALHQQAKAQAARWLAADPHLDPGAAYSRAALELADQGSLWLAS